MRNELYMKFRNVVKEAFDNHPDISNISILEMQEILETVVNNMIKDGDLSNE